MIISLKLALIALVLWIATVAIAVKSQSFDVALWGMIISLVTSLFAHGFWEVGK